MDKLIQLFRVQANKHISCHWLMDDEAILGNLQGILEHGVQVSMDAEEIRDEGVEISIGFAGSVGTILWSEIKEDHAKVVLGLHRPFLV
jgi:hypothetical protein